MSELIDFPPTTVYISTVSIIGGERWVFGGRNERDAYLNKVRFGLIGGGFGALIGRVHKMAAELSGSAELVCGVFSRDPNQSKKSWCRTVRYRPHRSYPDVETMCLTESAVDESRRAEVMIVATPNHSHFGNS